jgi:hypothetical protein
METNKTTYIMNTFVIFSSSLRNKISNNISGNYAIKKYIFLETGSHSSLIVENVFFNIV